MLVRRAKAPGAGRLDHCMGSEGNVAVGVAPNEAHLGQTSEHLDHLDRVGAEEHQVTEGPPLVDVVGARVGEHCM